MLVVRFAYNEYVKKLIFTKKDVFLLMQCFLLLLVSCSTHKPEKKFRIGFSQCTTHDVWRQSMQKEMERELSFHPEIDFILKEANLNSQKQVQQIQELINQKIDLLIVSPNEAAPITPIIDKVYKEGTPVIVVDRNILSKNYTAFIGTSNYNIGLNAGNYANALLKGKGNVMEIGGLDVGSSADIGRHNGFKDFIKQYPGIKFIKRISQNWDGAPAEAGKELADELIKNDDIQLIFAQNDRIGFGAYKVCKKLGIDKKIFIIGVDGLPGENGGIDLVEKGILKGTILYPTGGKEAIQTAVNILEKKTYEKENALATTIIDSTNVRIMRMQNEKVLAQQEDIDKRQKKIEEQIAITRNQANIIVAISITLALALIFGGIVYYYLQENKMKLNASENNISDFVTEITNAFRDIAKKKFISYNITSKVKDLNIWFDVTMLDKVLFNLLSNAFKFTGENGIINVTIDKSRDGGFALIKVEDSGIGMSTEDAEHAFDLFYQGHSSSFKGTGLGLSLSKELIHLHHGSITVKSEKGKGTTFEVKLPLGKSHLEADEILTQKPALINTYEDIKIYTTDMEPVVVRKETTEIAN